jgi:hypothetical protein
MSLPQQLEVLLGDEQQQQQQQTDVGADRDGTDGEELASEWLDRVRHVAVDATCCSTCTPSFPCSLYGHYAGRGCRIELAIINKLTNNLTSSVTTSVVVL